MLFETNSIDFDKLGSEAASLFFDASIPLNEIVVKLAEENELNPEELKRLVEKTNTFTSVKMIKAASDKTVEFDLADYAFILKQTHPEGYVTTQKIKTASEIPEKMPETLKDLTLLGAQTHSFFETKIEKVAAESKTKPMTKIFKLQQEISKIGQEKVAAELSFKKAADQLISNFSNLYGPDFTKFANEAYTLYGEPGKCILNVLAESVRVSTEFNKVAYVVNDIDNIEMDLFKTAYDSLRAMDVAGKGLLEAKEALTGAWADVRGGIV